MSIEGWVAVIAAGVAGVSAAIAIWQAKAAAVQAKSAELQAELYRQELDEARAAQDRTRVRDERAEATAFLFTAAVLTDQLGRSLQAEQIQPSLLLPDRMYERRIEMIGALTRARAAASDPAVELAMLELYKNAEFLYQIWRNVAEDHVTVEPIELRRALASWNSYGLDEAWDLTRVQCMELGERTRSLDSRRQFARVFEETLIACHRLQARLGAPPLSTNWSPEAELPER